MDHQPAALPQARAQVTALPARAVTEPLVHGQ